MATSLNTFPTVTGRASVTSASKTANVLTGVAGKTIFMKSVMVSVTLGATGGGGIVTLRDGVGGNILWATAATAIQSFPVYFGEDYGFPLTIGNSLSLEVSAAVTTDASAVAIGYGDII